MKRTYTDSEMAAVHRCIAYWRQIARTQEAIACELMRLLECDHDTVADVMNGCRTSRELRDKYGLEVFDANNNQGGVI